MGRKVPMATGLRCIRDRLGRSRIIITYWENGYPENEIAEESLKDKDRRESYAYDPSPEALHPWADSSLNPLAELRRITKRTDAEMKLMLQSVRNKEIRPYADEMRTRNELEGLKEIVQVVATQVSQLQWFRHHDQLTVGLTGLVKDLQKEVKKRNQRGIREWL